MENERFLQDKPELARILSLYGNQTLEEYIDTVNADILSFDDALFRARFDEFSQSYFSVMAPILGEAVARDSLVALASNRLVSTADHQGIITHPFFLSTTYARSLHALRNGYKSVVTFPCSGVSLSNSSFPRGVAYHTADGELTKLFFHSLASAHTPVYGAPCITASTLEKALDHTPLPKHVAGFLKSLRADEKFLTLPDYDAQCTYASHRLWKQVPGFEDINLIYLSEERLTTALLLDHHLGQGTLIDRLLTNETVLSLFEKYFDGITGAFSHIDASGTFLFWGLKDDKRLSLVRSGNTLVSRGGEYMLLLTPESIVQALKLKQIYPSMALCFIVLSFYYGLVCGGGFSQVQYLKALKDAWNSLLGDLDDIDEQKSLAPLSPSIFLGEVVALSQNGYPLYSLDLLSSGGEVLSTYQKATVSGGFKKMSQLFASTLRSVFD